MASLIDFNPSSESEWSIDAFLGQSLNEKSFSYKYRRKVDNFLLLKTKNFTEFKQKNLPANFHKFHQKIFRSSEKINHFKSKPNTQTVALNHSL